MTAETITRVLMSFQNSKSTYPALVEPEYEDISGENDHNNKINAMSIDTGNRIKGTYKTKVFPSTAVGIMNRYFNNEFKESLAEKCHITSETLRYTIDGKKQPTKDTCLKIIIGLKFNQKDAYDFLKAEGYFFGESKRDRILNEMILDTVEENQCGYVDQLLVECDCDPLYRGR